MGPVGLGWLREASLATSTQGSIVGSILSIEWPGTTHSWERGRGGEERDPTLPSIHQLQFKELRSPVTP